MLQMPVRDIGSFPRPVELTAKQLFMIFPTPMFTGMLPDITVCDRVEKKLREIQKTGKGHPSPGAVLAYMTPDDLQNLPEMQELNTVIMAEAGAILDAIAVKRESHYITNMWANIANPNRRHNFHIHPNCFRFSGVPSTSLITPNNRALRTHNFCFVYQGIRKILSRLMGKEEKPVLMLIFFQCRRRKAVLMIWPSSRLANGVEE